MIPDALQTFHIQFLKKSLIDEENYLINTCKRQEIVIDLQLLSNTLCCLFSAVQVQRVVFHVSS